MLKMFIKKLTFLISFLIIFLISKTISLGPLLGSLNSKILATQIVLPIVGVFSNGIGVIVISILWSLLSWSFKFNLYSLSSVYHIPSLFASLSLSGRFSRLYISISKYINYLIPAVCGLLFIAHPVGLSVPFYVLYWAVPIFVQFFAFESIFFRCLAATFIAHALGTVLFIYSFSTDINLWLNLAKIVWLERVIIALGMSLSYTVLKSGIRVWRSRYILTAAKKTIF